ncbi:N-acetylmuramoyl-L-alanine amidase [Amphiplicatus metriothermophilus]|uniref:N-acetylmuramoyl-L-alanine amidase n=1 Tax=Amphiplicatus metriothermophilus TaxID=1519374 RepID=A0A239PS13_9PROT|nr:N-acetylmuramoyl-L-alanine amidase [Amphiplicatus metriothermophilus]MBB5518332.1 N-acetylmuramoyl-L-alanine amidase [Amphiplicatus metriothermophilus]SNT72497.1 N-acetylmuramoyl-L-alanine amidase [Amphiplicatus metriothermophilus]
MKIIDQPSPNFDERDVNGFEGPVDMIVLHYTGMKTGEEAIARLRDPAGKVSAHYFIEEDGRIFRLVAEEKRAWHAGLSSWKGEGEINARSIGIELVNPGHEWGYRDFPPAQIDALVALLKDIRARRKIAAARVLAHSDVAPARKEDPGERFPWARLAQEGLALGPYDGPPNADVPYADALAALRAIGYEVADAAPGAPAPAAAILAFQRRFCRAALGQGMNPLTKAALLWAAALT